MMIARRNLACLASNSDAFLCKSRALFFHQIHSFSTSNEKQVVDLLVDSHHFSPKIASLLAKNCSPERGDSVVSLLKENGFSIAQLEKLFTSRPRILGLSDEDILLKLKIFQDLGFSSEEIAKLMSKHPNILHLNARGKIIPRLNLLKGLLGSDHDVARALRRSIWFLSVDLEKTLSPNVEIMKCCGIPMKHICYFLLKYPRCLLKSDVLKKSIDKVNEMGATQSRRMFVHCVGVVASFGEDAWELKWRAIRELGFSDSVIVEMFNKEPTFYCVSTEKMKSVMELLLATGKFDLSSIANYPSVFGRSIEERLKPRLQVLEILESRKVIKKWPSLSTISVFPDDRFFESFVEPFSDDVDESTLMRLRPKS